MDVEAERVVAPGDVLQALLDAAVVLGLDDALLAIVGPRVGGGGAECDTLIVGEGKELAAQLALSRDRIGETRAAAGDDLDLRGDELTGDALVQRSRARGRAVAQLLEALRQVEVCGSAMENEPDSQVACSGEQRCRTVEIDHVR